MAAADEASCTLLALPDGLVDRIAYLLPPGDRRNLAATCAAFHAAGRRWFSGTVVRVWTGNSRLAELTRWLEERQALVAYNLSGSAQSIQADLAALPAGHVVAIQHWTLDPWAAPAVLAPPTALTSLHLSHQIQLNIGKQLEQILRPLALLRDLDLTNCQLAAVPAALSCCTQLTRLDLSSNHLDSGWHHLQPLAHLRELDLSYGSILPASLPLPTQLTRLDLSHCSNVPAGSRQLTALRLLRHLDLSECGLTEVPSAVSTLTTLTGLSLGHNRLLPPGGLDHLRPLRGCEAWACIGTAWPRCRQQFLLFHRCYTYPWAILRAGGSTCAPWRSCSP